MNLMKTMMTASVLALSAVSANAATITVDIVDEDSLKFNFTDVVLADTAPEAATGVLYFDLPTTSWPDTGSYFYGDTNSTAQAGTSDLSLANIALQEAKFRTSDQAYSTVMLLSFGTALSSGTTLSGVGSVNFNKNHGLSKDDFSGGGVDVFWGVNNGEQVCYSIPGALIPMCTPGAFKPGAKLGSATLAQAGQEIDAPAPVPLPAAAPMLIAGLGALGFVARRRKKAA